MKIQRIAIHSLRLITFTALISVIQVQAAQAQAPQGKPVTIRGKIAAVEKQALKVTTSAGEVPVKLPEDVRVGGVEAAKLLRYHRGELTPHNRGQTSRRQFKALEVHIYPRAHAAPVKDTGHGIYSLAQR